MPAMPLLSRPELGIGRKQIGDRTKEGMKTRDVFAPGRDNDENPTGFRPRQGYAESNARSRCPGIRLAADQVKNGQPPARTLLNWFWRRVPAFAGIAFSAARPGTEATPGSG
jgi:hypothetical protein